MGLSKVCGSYFVTDLGNVADYSEQNFGVDLEARARVDRKRVPILVTTILTYLDDRKFGQPSNKGGS